MAEKPLTGGAAGGDAEQAAGHLKHEIIEPWLLNSVAKIDLIEEEVFGAGAKRNIFSSAALVGTVTFYLTTTRTVIKWC